MDKNSVAEVSRLIGEAKRKISEVMRRERIGYNERDALSSAVNDISVVENAIVNASSRSSSAESV